MASPEAMQVLKKLGDEASALGLSGSVPSLGFRV